MERTGRSEGTSLSISMESGNTQKPSLPDTLARVRHVFGDSVVIDDDKGEDDSFFMYTPSPAKPDHSQDNGSANKRGSNELGSKSGGSTEGNSTVENSQPTTSASCAVDKENSEASNTTLHISQPPKPKPPSPALGYSQRSALNRQSRSLASSDLMQKTQAAIGRAELSLKQSFGLADKKGKQKTKKKLPLVDSGITTEFHNEWEKDLQEAKEFYREMQRKKFEGLRLQRQLSSQASRNKAGFHELLRHSKLQRIEEETQFKSSVYQEHVKCLREERERRRRESEDKRSKLRANARLGLERLQTEKQEEDAAMFDDRHAASEALRKAKKEAAEQRRKSFQFRSGDARRIREICSKMRTEQAMIQQRSYELELQAAKDVADAKREEAKQKQKALEELNAEARVARQLQAKKDLLEAEKCQKSFEMKRASEKDVETYLQKMDNLRRESLAFRGKEFVRQKKIVSEDQAKAQEAEHESYEMKREAEKDVEQYYKKQQEERRASLANRNVESSRHAKVMQEIQLLAREKETESVFLKWAGEDDVKEYEKKLQRERKESLDQRAKEKVRMRQQDAEEQRKQIEKAHDDETLRSSDQKEVEAYRRKCAERDRASLEFRNKEARKQRIQEEEAKKEERQAEVKDFELETMAHKDVEEYIKECKQRRRYSLVFRAKEKRRHIQWKEQKEKEELSNQSQIIRGKLTDQRYMELVKQQELTARAMEAIQHQLRLYGSKTKNPFHELLD